MNPEIKPLVSIITVTYNAEKYLEKTILSVISQTYRNIEYIIIDGGSKDETLSIIKKHESHISKWISEPDKGLYDAMNKGIDLAEGEYLWFMNAGDEINDNHTIENIFRTYENADFYYGESLIISEKGSPIGLRSDITTQKLPSNLTWKSMDKGMIVCHQSIVLRKSITPKFKIKYPYVADIDWTIVALKNSQTIINTGLVLSKFMANPVLGKFYAGGQSTPGGFLKGMMERFQIFVIHFGLFRTIINHILIMYRALRFKPGK